jgi:periplasmic protein CpxP/Spy
MNFKRIMPVVLGAAMSLTPLMGLAEGTGDMGGHGGMHGRGMHGLGRMLDLTDQQKQQLASARKAERERMKPYHDQIKATHKQIQEEIANGSFNEAKTRSLLAQSAQARTELELSHARMQAAFYNLLTPEQRTKLNEQKQQWEQRKQERKQKLEQEKSSTSQ